LLFENLVVRDLRIYAQALDAQIYAYREMEPDSKQGATWVHAPNAVIGSTSSAS
jgi:hypothetical protein